MPCAGWPAQGRPIYHHDMADTLVTLAELRAAQQRIAGTAVRTPLVSFHTPGVYGDVWLKNEGAQPIGSFKLRGAYNKIAQLTEAERARGVITYSSGNHAQGVAYAARAVETKAVIVMPRQAPAVKIEATRVLGAEIVFVETTSSAERKARAEELLEEHGYVMIPPYDDPAIIAGQGTCGLEISGGGSGCGPCACARERGRPALRHCGCGQASAAVCARRWCRAGARCRRSGEPAHRATRHLACCAHQPNPGRWAADTIAWFAQLRARSGIL